jgi:hypothetical protein
LLQTFNPVPVDAVLRRLNADGSPDASFGGGEMIYGLPFGLDQFALPLPDDSLIIAGWTEDARYGGFVLAKIEPDGGIPDTFDPVNDLPMPMPGLPDPVDPAQNAGSDDGTHLNADPTAGFGLVGNEVITSTSDNRGLFGDVPGVSIWNPFGKREVYDDSAGAL